jgi:hypothetical protein
LFNRQVIKIDFGESAPVIIARADKKYIRHLMIIKLHQNSIFIVDPK